MSYKKKGIKMKFLAVLVFLVITLIFSGCEMQDSETECSVDSDCVPATCCHPDLCVNIDFKPDCETVLCTMECRPGTMDCGQGSCKCLEGKCEAIIQSKGSAGSTALANPAAVYCVEQGYDYEIISNEQGQYGVCIFPDGSECMGWEYYRGECKPGDSYEVD